MNGFALEAIRQGAVDWSKVTPREIQELSKKMLDAAHVPPRIRAEYFRSFHRFSYEGPWLMANLYDLLSAIGETPDCRVLPTVGEVPWQSDILPEDLRAFYSECGGLTLFMSGDYPISIVSPARFRRANPVVLKSDCIDDISYHWFIVAENAGDIITIDCHPDRLGRCYDSHFEGHAMPGSCPIIARGFTSLLSTLFENRGEHWYWLRPDYQSMGDAYDGIKK